MPLHLTCDPGLRADVQAELRRLIAHFDRVSPVPHDVDVEARRCRRIVAPDGQSVCGSEGAHPDTAGEHLNAIAEIFALYVNRRVPRDDEYDRIRLGLLRDATVLLQKLAEHLPLEIDLPASALF